MSGTAPFASLRRWLRVELLEDRTTPTTLNVNPSAFAADRVLVTLAPGADQVSTLAGLSASPYTAGVERLAQGIYQVNLRPGVSVQSAIPALDAVRGVATAEADYTIGVTTTPNDPSYGSLWGMNNTGQSGGTVDADIDAAEAWDTARGSATGKIVAVIDTGVDYNHPDLAANMWRNPGESVQPNGMDEDGNGIVDDIYGADFANNDGDPMDDNNHGTHCAGTIGAVGNNGVGVVGVAWTTRIMALKFLTASGSGNTSNAIKCIDYAIAKGASILSNSWGGGGYSQALQDAITRAQQAGAVFVAAAGNSGLNTDTSANYPSNYAGTNVLSVAALDRNNNLASFSNYGANTVDLGAPGVSILSTTRNNTYSTFSGTSMATPHVAGAIAVYWDANPTLTYTQVIQALLGSVDATASLVGKSVTGGRLNLDKMLDYSGSQPSPPTDTTGARVTAATFSGTITSFNKVRVTFNEAVTVSSFTSPGVVSITGPGGAVISPTSVTPLSGSSTQFEIAFANQTAVGSYSITVGPNVLDLANDPNPMDQNQNGQNGELTADRFTGGAILYPTRQTFDRTPLTIAIPDRSTVNVPVTVPAESVVNGFKITDVNFSITLTHTYTSDLRISLISPAGTLVRLFNRRGGSGDNLSGTTFNDEAGTAISAGAAPFSGSFRPEQLLSLFDGQNPVGTWTVRVEDLARTDVGTITAVSINIATSPADSATAFGVMDSAGGSSGPVTVGPGVAAGDLTADTPVLLAPPTSAPSNVAAPRPPATTDATITGTSPAARPSFGGMANFEPSSVEWLGLTTRPAFGGISVV